MRDLSGKVAFITGGASGIGLAMARVFGREGMKIMLADIEAETLAAAVEELRGLQIRAEGVVADAASRDSLKSAARETIERFGKVHLVCNNAGVAAGGPFGTVPEKDWGWVTDVNQFGVVHGMEIFAPLIIAQGEGGHFVNTASMAGFVSPPGMEPYSATKFAVVAMSEGWAGQLAPLGIGVSILCPGFVKTRIHESRRNRPAGYGEDDRPPGIDAILAAPVLNGISVEPVAERALEGVLEGDLYIFTHPEMRGFVEERFARVLAAFDKAAASPALARGS
jgi:NAD(P)-dependent dehydrogenase (short-subunit alcohol dehydrogenase family)